MERALEYWQVFLGIIALAVWLVRLESGMLQNRRDIQRLEQQRHDDLERAERNEAQVNRKLDEIHKDLRGLLVALERKQDR